MIRLLKGKGLKTPVQIAYLKLQECEAHNWFELYLDFLKELKKYENTRRTNSRTLS